MIYISYFFLRKYTKQYRTNIFSMLEEMQVTKQHVMKHPQEESMKICIIRCQLFYAGMLNDSGVTLVQLTNTSANSTTK